MAKPIRLMDQKKIWGLIEVSKGNQAATTWIKGGFVLNVYTGKLEKADVVLYEDRIAYVGSKSPKADNRTNIIDASDFKLVPGYIEPHAHPFQLYNLKTLSEFALSLGTTTMVNDSLIYYLNSETNEELEYLLDYSSNLPIKSYWWARLDSNSMDPDMLPKFTNDRVMRMLNHELILQAGELTSWQRLLDGDEVMLDGIMQTRRLGKRIEGHNPGASLETLNTMAALGVSACHEAITGEEVMRRLSVGMYATLRHSSIRPDLPILIKGLQELNFNFHTAFRLMMTTDGSMPPFHRHGFIDSLIKIALENGVPAQVAYQLVTLNPAVYYGIDQEVGGIAPGRIADILFLESLESPTPIRVMSNGKITVEHGQLLEPFPDINWERMKLKPLQLGWRLQKEWLDIEKSAEPFPVVEMRNAVITKLVEEHFHDQDGNITLDEKKEYCYVSLIDRNGKWITNGILKGFASQLGALATSYTSSQDILVIGQNKEDMVQAVNEILDNGGGIVLKEEGNTLFQLLLPIAGKMSDLPMSNLIEKTSLLLTLLGERGHVFLDPYFTMLFLTATLLPDIRLTRDGIYSTKGNRVLYPSKPL